MIALYVSLALLLLLLALGYFLSRKMTDRHVPDEHRSPAEYGLEFEEVSFPAGDGLTLRGWWIPAPEAKRYPSGRGPEDESTGLAGASMPDAAILGPERAVIMLHGQAGSMDPDIQYVPALHAAGFGVLLFDFRAHGRSEGRLSTIGYLERQDVLGAVAFLRAKGIVRIGLLGFSMGARVAILTAPLCPEVRAIVVDGGPPRMLPAIAARAQEMGLPEELAVPIAWLTLAVTSLRVRANLFYAEPLRWVARVAPRAIFFIHGDRDPYIPAAEFDALVAAAGPPKEVWRLSEAGHRTADQVYPVEYRRRVVAFFQRYL